MVRSCGLGPPQHGQVQDFVFELEHGALAFLHEAAPLDGVEHVFVEVAAVGHGAVAAVVAAAFGEPVVERLADAAQAEEAWEGVQLRHAVLHGWMDVHHGPDDSALIHAHPGAEGAWRMYIALGLSDEKMYQMALKAKSLGFSLSKEEASVYA